MSISKKTGGATNDFTPSTPSKGEERELTPTEVEDLKLFNQDDDADYDEIMELEF